MNIKEIINKKYEELNSEEFDYYQENFEDIFIGKIDNKISFSEEEIEDIVWGSPEEIIVDTEKSEDLDRWSRGVNTFLKIHNRFFRISWEEGLTEYQENYYPYQPIEVKKHEKQITIIEWEEI